jgi:hypothetical protein
LEAKFKKATDGGTDPGSYSPAKGKHSGAAVFRFAFSDQKIKREKTDWRRKLLPNREHAVRHVGDINITVYWIKYNIFFLPFRGISSTGEDSIK